MRDCHFQIAVFFFLYFFFIFFYEKIGFANKGIRNLSRALKENKNLRYLNVDYNSFQNKVIRNLCGMLKVNRSLTQISTERLLGIVGKEDREYREKKMNFLLFCNQMWSPQFHCKYPRVFMDASLCFVLVLKRIQKSLKISLPKFIKFEIIKRIDLRSFSHLVKTEKDRKRKRVVDEDSFDSDII